MNITEAFDTFQTAVNADKAQVQKAQRRRDLMHQAFVGAPGVDETFPSGSLARGTILAPIHDVDYVVVYEPSAHPHWGTPGDSAKEALDHVAARIKETLGAGEGSMSHEVRLASSRNHAVKCFLDDPVAESPFTVDVTPALPKDGHIVIPEADSRDWIETDPRDLIRRIGERHKRWNRFVPMVRVLKHWNRDVAKAQMLSLAVEVLTYNCLPDSYMTGEGESRPEALSRFFTSAVIAIENPIEDPAGLCGAIQPDLDVATARTRLQEASDGAFRALAAERIGDVDAAICEWRGVLGDAFPEPPDGCDKKKVQGAAGPVFIAARPIRDTPQGCWT
jgi:Second Messenger Oligonucleotide or Dinucleotide Synthetase domain